MTDERDHAAAWRAAIDGRPETVALYDYDDVPDPLPRVFLLLSVERRYGERTRSGAPSNTGWRATTRAVGSTVDECRWALKVATDAVDGLALSVDGEPTTPVRFESGQAPAADDGRYSAHAIWTYVH